MRVPGNNTSGDFVDFSGVRDADSTKKQEKSSMSSIYHGRAMFAAQWMTSKLISRLRDKDDRDSLKHDFNQL